MWASRPIRMTFKAGGRLPPLRSTGYKTPLAQSPLRLRRFRLTGARPLCRYATSPRTAGSHPLQGGRRFCNRLASLVKGGGCELVSRRRDLEIIPQAVEGFPANQIKDTRYGNQTTGNNRTRPGAGRGTAAAGAAGGLSHRDGIRTGRRRPERNRRGTNLRRQGPPQRQPADCACGRESRHCPAGAGNSGESQKTF